MPPWEKYQKPEDGPWKKYQPPPEPAFPEGGTLDQRLKAETGIDADLPRNTWAPLYRTPEGEYDWRWPGFLVEPIRAGMTAEHVRKGGSVTPEDTTRAALSMLPMGRVGVLGRNPTKKEVLRQAPTREELKDLSSAAYKAARREGVVTRGDAADLMLARLEGQLQELSIDEILTPNAHRVLELWRRRAGQDLSLSDLERMRRQAGMVAQSPKSDAERTIAYAMQDAIDEFVEGLGPAQLASNAADPKAAAAALKQAREMWKRQRKMGTIDRIFEIAELSASGFENGLRIGFRALLKNENKLRGFSAAEIKEMKKLAKGGSVRNFLIKIGKLGYGGRGANSWLGGTAGTIIGHNVAGPVGAVAVPMAGAAAQAGAAARAASQVELLRSLIARGGQLPTGGVISPLTAAAIRYWGPAAATMTQERPDRWRDFTEQLRLRRRK